MLQKGEVQGITNRSLAKLTIKIIMTVDTLTLTSLKKKISDERNTGGLIFIKSVEGSDSPKNFKYSRENAISGYWRNGLKKRSPTWIMVYQALPKNKGRVWVGEYAGALGSPGQYQIKLNKLQGPLEVELSLKELTGKAHPQNPVYLAPRDVIDDKAPNGIVDDFFELLGGSEGKKLSAEKEQLILARIGQGLFRKKVLRQWGGACAVTNSKTLAAIRASHIRPWRKCSKEADKLNPDNGLPLVASLDALFDKGLISFDVRGVMLVSTSLSEEEQRMFGVPANLRRPPSPSQQHFLRYHLAHVFQK